MKLLLILMVILLSGTSDNQKTIHYNQVPKGVNIKLPDGTLGIYPIADNAVRIRFFEKQEFLAQELVFLPSDQIPEYSVSEKGKNIRISLKNILVDFNRSKSTLTFFDKNGKKILSEEAGSRILRSDSIMGEPCYFVEQSFESPADEYIFGLGQFQDGHYNVKGISRRLTQVNSQIAIPFIYSSRGYGILWHQYGLTDFNPADNYISLKKIERKDVGENLVEVTTTAGTQKVSQNQSLYTGKLIVPRDGEYSIFMDLGGMGNRHFVIIDDKACIDQTNMWLPPTAGALVYLKKGEHNIQLICKSDNKPKLSWKQKDSTTTFRSPVAKMMDYVVFSGSAEEVIASYRNLTGNAPMLPKWAYGFWQCRERYTSGEHLVETVKEFRKRDLPLDVIVQDWQYWGSRGWGVPQFDEKNYPNPAGFIKELHDLNAHFNISIWSNPDKNSTIGKEYVKNSRFIPDTKWLDYFNPDTRKEYWKTLKDNMFEYGVDSWWMDAVEPENDALKGTTTHIGIGDFYRLTYPLMVSEAVYEGQRETTSEKRVSILTRSAFSGQQRYGIINWSGDIGGTWDVYRNQIVAGLNFTITGFPYWTTDIGGFFRPGNSQYTDEKYHELLIRWFQWGTFNPIFRMHAYQTETEPWKYGQTVEDNMRKMMNLRYRLLPYIYSEAWNVTENGSTMMRPMVMDFNNDAEAVSQSYEFMFGKAILVAPITEAGAMQRKVYLPDSEDWFNFWTGENVKGGQTIIAEAPLDKIPLYIKAGSILPMGPIIQHSNEKPNEAIEIRVYEGSDGEFSLYEDENDNYNYEKGFYSSITFIWNDTKRTLTINDREGSFPGMIAERNFNIVLISKNKIVGSETERIDKAISYRGREITTGF